MSASSNQQGSGSVNPLGHEIKSAPTLVSSSSMPVQGGQQGQGQGQGQINQQGQGTRVVGGDRSDLERKRMMQQRQQMILQQQHLMREQMLGSASAQNSGGADASTGRLRRPKKAEDGGDESESSGDGETKDDEDENGEGDDDEDVDLGKERREYFNEWIVGASRFVLKQSTMIGRVNFSKLSEIYDRWSSDPMANSSAIAGLVQHLLEIGEKTQDELDTLKKILSTSVSGGSTSQMSAQGQGQSGTSASAGSTGAGTQIAGGSASSGPSSAASSQKQRSRPRPS